MAKLDVSGTAAKTIDNLQRHFVRGDQPAEAPTSAERKASEKPPLSPLDGRVARGKGKNVPLNFRVTPDFKKSFLEEAQARGITMTDLLEVCFDALPVSEKGTRK